ncbi:LysR family transcriptional regulator [Pseudomonas sp. S32]|nr:LysR family transcriptional regulator [Pseudomonas sp. S32]
MTEVVIDGLEVVHVHGDDRKRLAKALGTLTLTLERILQPVAVGKAGQGIALGKLAVLVQLALQLLIDLRQFTGALGNQLFERLVATLQLRQLALASIDVTVSTEHTGYRAIRVAGDDIAAVLDPQVTAIAAAAAILDQVAFVALVDVRIEVRHHPGVVLWVNHVLPREHRVVHGMHGVTEHGVPTWVAVNVAGIGVPIPYAIADQLEQGMQLLVTEAGRRRLGTLIHGSSLMPSNYAPLKGLPTVLIRRTRVIVICRGEHRRLWSALE